MHVALLAVAFQLQVAALPAPQAQGVSATHAADSTRDLKAARSAQATFEFARRSSLPQGFASRGQCDVRLGRWCWWLDEVPPKLPPEPSSIVRRRASLIATLDSLGELHPGDNWIAGMRVHYRLDGKDPALTAAADTVARACRATTWWCLALVGYANHLLGQAAAAESAFTSALANMPDDERCKWQDISVLLPANRPSEPFEPKPLRVMLMAIAAGLVLGAAGVMGREYLDRSVHDARGLRDEFEVPVLAEIPRINPVM